MFKCKAYLFSSVIGQLIQALKYGKKQNKTKRNKDNSKAKQNDTNVSQFNANISGKD